MAATCDALVIGGGVVGLATALEIRRRHPTARIVVLEKEPSCGAHASGRNSGVLHAGFYYTADSFKARFCRDGNRAMSAWCAEHRLPLRRCGKLVVAASEADLPGLDELVRRGTANGVDVHSISADEARRIEPRSRTFERALWSPSTAVVDPLAVMTALDLDARREGVEVRCGVAWRGVHGRSTLTSSGAIEAGFVVNAAGLHADEVARAHGFSADKEIVPFRGRYLYANRLSLATCVYPVPDLEMPFLGVHWTVDVAGRTKIGPTASLAAWREHYRGLTRFSPRELVRGAAFLTRRLAVDRAFRRHAAAELAKSSRRELVARAALLVDGAEPGDFRRWGRSGIRAQLFDHRRGELVMDFDVEGDDRSLHVLNAVSPAFTCAFPFAAWLADRTPFRA